MPRFTTSANCTGTLSAAQKTPETARPRSETQPEWGKRGRPPPAMRGPEAATPRVTRYSATASVALCNEIEPKCEFTSNLKIHIAGNQLTPKSEQYFDPIGARPELTLTSQLEFGQFQGVRGGCRGRRGSDMSPLVRALGYGVEPG